MQIVLEVRQFLCGNAACPQRTFAEQIPVFTSTYARCTDRLSALLNVVALALAVRAGARMGRLAGYHGGPDGAAGPVRALPDPLYDTPRVLGVDDFSLGQAMDLALRAGPVWTSAVGRRLVSSAALCDGRQHAHRGLFGALTLRAG
ncbi:hypothetical protein ACFTZI_00745 [Streptomyces decoyicus]|uniref:hypothetical protein n=1 Tax=Streptomyces decoyicus TaxID=249567 RepID=UPI0036340EDA